MSFLLDLVIVCLITMCCLGWAQEPQNPVYNFQEWKEQQVLDAQNQMLRVSSRITQLRSGKSSPGNRDSSFSLPNGRVKKAADSDSVANAERDLKRAQDVLETANELRIEEYISVYLPTIQDQPDALNKLAEKMSKEQLAEIFKYTYGKASHVSDARRNKVSSLTH
jgi:hypothetical protein